MSSGVKVGVRIRPLLPKERHQGISFNSYDSTSVDFKGQTFTFDHVFGTELSQQDLYNETAAPMLKSFLEGYNVTVIAYGQTGSGKTFSMGTSDIADVMEDSQGLIPRFVTDLFENLKSGVEGGRLIDSKVMISFLEIYGEDVFDLNGHGERVSLPIREDLTGGRGIFVEGLQCVQVSSAVLALDLLCNGTKNRVTGSTQMNAGSSRSHAVYTISLEQTLQSSSSDDDIHQMHSKLTFVDLAGSERLKRTGAEGQRLKEGIQINSGLFNLGQVINCLADDQKLKNGGKPNHVPYRNSKLTHLLKDALGGNSQTLFLACVSPAESNENETLSTLNYARQARNIENKPVVNMDKAQQELRHLKYAVKTWMMKAIAQKFGVRLSQDEFRSNAATLGSVYSPLPCTSPLPSVRPGSSSTTKIGNNDMNADLLQIMQRADVREYMNAVNKAIDDKLLIGNVPTPRKIRLSLAGELASPYRNQGPRRNLQGVAKTLCMPLPMSLESSGSSSRERARGVKGCWDDVPVGGGSSDRMGMGMDAIKEDKAYSSGKDLSMINSSAQNSAFRRDDISTSTSRVGRTRGRESVLFSAALKEKDGDPDETERLVARMLEMINIEKQVASESVDEDFLNISTLIDSDHEMEEEEEERNQRQQAKKIVEVDNVIVEKEEILKKLLDTVRGYSAMKSDFERLLEAIGTLESERQSLETELEKTKRSAEGFSASQSPPPSNTSVERIKERFLKVKEELRMMREERTKKENAYRLMQRESKQCDIIQKELLKLKESKVVMQRQQRLQGQQMAKMKKDQQSKLTTMKKSDVKKQQQMNTLKGELIKRERILSHKDREIVKINSKLKACEDHIAQLLKLQNKSRARTTGTVTSPTTVLGKGSLSALELEHLKSSKAMLDGFVSDRVEKWKNNALFERKSNTLKELNKELEQEAKELEVLMKKKKVLYEAAGKEEDQDDHDAEDFSLNNTCDADETTEDIEARTDRLAVRQRIREMEGSIDGITRDLDLLNTDLENLAQNLEGFRINGVNQKNKKSPGTGILDSDTDSWEDMGREIVMSFSLPQCQSLLWDQISEKATLLEQIRAVQFKQQEALDEAKTATSQADSVSRQLAYAKADMQNRLHRAEKQRVQDVWALLKVRSKDGEGASAGDRDVEGGTIPLSDSEAMSATRVAIQRAQDLEGELDAYVVSDEKHTKESVMSAERISALEAALLKVQLRSQMSRFGSDNGTSRRESGVGGGSAGDCFEALSSIWDTLGVKPEERSIVVDDIQKVTIKARENALLKAKETLSGSQQKADNLYRNLSVIAVSLGQDVESYFSDVVGLVPSGSSGSILERLNTLPALPRLQALRKAIDSATAVLTVRSSSLEKLRERLIDTMSEMWLDNTDLPECLHRVLGVDFLAASTAANQCMDDFDEDNSSDGEDAEDETDGIASFMVTSALCVASQLEKNKVLLTESNISNCETEMRMLNVMRAKLTTQMVAARSETSLLFTALNLTTESLQAIVSEGSVLTDAQGAAVELVTSPAISNPPGSQKLLSAVSFIKKTLENVKSDRHLAAAIASKFSSSLSVMLIGDEDVKNSPKKIEESLENVLSTIDDVTRLAPTIKEQLTIQLKELLKPPSNPSTSTSTISCTKVDDGSKAELIDNLLAMRLMLPTPPGVISLERDLSDLETLACNSKDSIMKNAITSYLSSWGKFSDRGSDGCGTRVIVMQVCVLRVEVRRLLRLSETMHDLQRLDAQLLKHIGEMEEFEAASKQDRIKLLSGSSKALIEEEKFRKNGKRKYEQITERMISIFNVLEQLNAKDGSSSPIPGSQNSGFMPHIPLDFSCLSSQGQALLRGKGHWQDRVELMHLHTTTHGTRRWSGGGDKEKEKDKDKEKERECTVSPVNTESEISPKGSSEVNFFSSTSTSTLSSKSRQAVPALALSGAIISPNPFAAAAAHSTPSVPSSSTANHSVHRQGAGAHTHAPQQALSQLHVGLGALAVRGSAATHVHTHGPSSHSKAGSGSANVSSGSTTPRGKASAIAMNNSITAMNNSLATLSGCQRVQPYGNKGLNSTANIQKVGNENLGNTR